KRFCSISFNIGRLLISFLMRTPPFLFSREKLFYQRRESSSYFLEIEGILQLCSRKYFTHTGFFGFSMYLKYWIPCMSFSKIAFMPADKRYRHILMSFSCLIALDRAMKA